MVPRRTVYHVIVSVKIAEHSLANCSRERKGTAVARTATVATTSPICFHSNPATLLDDRTIDHDRKRLLRAVSPVVGGSPNRLPRPRQNSQLGNSLSIRDIPDSEIDDWATKSRFSALSLIRCLTARSSISGWEMSREQSPTCLTIPEH